MKSIPDQPRFPVFPIVCFFFIFLVLPSCNRAAQQPSESVPLAEINGEAISFLGDTLSSPELGVDEFLRFDSLLVEAKATYADDSTDLNAIIWYARRLAYLHRYKEAIRVLSRGITLHPASPELYRHRAHRYITIRRPVLAIQDLEYAADLAKGRKMEIEPDGIPNKLDIPLSNLHFNIYYHLGLARYLRAEYPQSITAFESCMAYADNADLVVATTYWLYLSYLRAGYINQADAVLSNIRPYMEIIENQAYLLRLLQFKGTEDGPSEASAQDDPMGYATSNYGRSCWLEVYGRKAEAASIRHQILSLPAWHSFGYIAAEADSARLLNQ
jgi:tetratricopeptide (TPR) repeat protein